MRVAEVVLHCCRTLLSVPPSGAANAPDLAAFLAQDMEVELSTSVADMLAISTHAVECLKPPLCINKTTRYAWFCVAHVLQIFMSHC